MLNHFGDAWSELSATFLEASKSPSPRLYYDGPEIRILPQRADWKRQFAALLVVEKDEWSLAPLRVPALLVLHAAPPGDSGSGSGSSSGEDDMDVNEDDKDKDDKDKDDKDEDDEEDDDENKHGDEAEEEQDSDDVIDITTSESDGEDSSSLSSMESDSPEVPTTARGAPFTRPSLKWRHPSPASTPSKSPSSSHPAKRPH
jgi:hypothetical protein